MRHWFSLAPFSRRPRRVCRCVVPGCVGVHLPIRACRLVKLVMFSGAVHMACFGTLSSLKFAVGSVQVFNATSNIIRSGHIRSDRVCVLALPCGSFANRPARNRRRLSNLRWTDPPAPPVVKSIFSGIRTLSFIFTAFDLCRDSLLTVGAVSWRYPPLVCSASPQELRSRSRLVAAAATA